MCGLRRTSVSQERELDLLQQLLQKDLNSFYSSAVIRQCFDLESDESMREKVRTLHAGLCHSFEAAMRKTGRGRSQSESTRGEG